MASPSDAPGRWIQFADFVYGLAEGFFFQSELLLYFVPMFTGEVFVTFGNNGFFDRKQRVGSEVLLLYLAPYLDEETLLQVAGSQSGRVEILNDFRASSNSPVVASMPA